MTETLISPGVLATETDKSFIKRGPISVGAAIVGPTAKGPVNLPTLITSYSEYEAVFGSSVMHGSQTYTYLTAISANNYFQQGGNTLLVTRAAPDLLAFTSASAPVLTNTEDLIAFEIHTISQGEVMNSGNDIDVNGYLEDGTKDNIRWEITYIDEMSGNFNLVVRRGDDSTKNKVILEQWKNLSLDPDASNFIERVIGNTSFEIIDGEVTPMGDYSNNSNFIIIKNTTPILNLPKLIEESIQNGSSVFSQYLPVVSEGGFEGGTGKLFDGTNGPNFYDKIDNKDTQGLKVTTGGIVTAYNKAFEVLMSKESYQFNVISAPGLNQKDHSNAIKKLVSIADSRQDCIAVIDLVGFNETNISTVVLEARGSEDSSYVSTYWPWLQTMAGGKTVWIPASTMIPGVYAFTDRSFEPWFAPAGMTRGGLGRVIQPAKKLTTKDRNDLYQYNVNPISYSPQRGVTVFGQKTMQKRQSALDRINVRRLLIEVKGYISQLADTLVFEQNTMATRNSFLAQANPYFETIQQRQGLYAFKVIMDESNNDAASIDRNELRGQILLQPTKTIEYVLLDFTVTPTGVDFSQY